MNQKTYLEGARNNNYNGTMSSKFNNHVILKSMILYWPKYDVNDSMKKCTILDLSLKNQI